MCILARNMTTMDQLIEEIFAEMPDHAPEGQIELLWAYQGSSRSDSLKDIRQFSLDCPAKEVSGRAPEGQIELLWAYQGSSRSDSLKDIRQFSLDCPAKEVSGRQKD